MIRFVNGIPKFAWFSQHANGEAFKFEVLKKDKSGMRVSPLNFLFPTQRAVERERSLPSTYFLYFESHRTL